MDVVLPVAAVIPVVSAWIGVAPARVAPTAWNQAVSLGSTLHLASRDLPRVPTALRLASSDGANGPGSPSGLDYAAVRALFESASDPAPSPAEMLRWRSGRLFKPERPTEPLNSLLVGAEVEAPEGRGLRVFPIQTLRPVDEIPDRPDLQQWVRDVVKHTPVSGPGPVFTERAVRFGLCAGGVCHRYEVRKKGNLVLLRYQAIAEASGEVLSTWYGLYPNDVTPK